MAPSANPPPEILFATDFSDCSRRALVCVRSIARFTRSAVRILHVIDLTSPRGSFAHTRDSAQRNLREMCRELRLAGIHETATLVVGGKPSLAIREAAAQFGSAFLALAFGSSPRSANGSTPTLGPTVKSLLRHPPCPVLTIGPACSVTLRPAMDRPHYVIDADFDTLESARRAWNHTVPEKCTVWSVLPSSSETPAPKSSYGSAPVRRVAAQDAARAILDCEPNVSPSLIVLGRARGSCLDSVAVGSLAHTILMRASSPVLSVAV